MTTYTQDDTTNYERDGKSPERRSNVDPFVRGVAQLELYGRIVPAVKKLIKETDNAQINISFEKGSKAAAEVLDAAMPASVLNNEYVQNVIKNPESTMNGILDLDYLRQHLSEIHEGVENA